MKNFLKSITFNIRNTIALIVVLSITGIIVLGHFKPIPEQNKDLISGAVNQYLVVGFAVVIAYFFVASKGEADRQKHLQSMDAAARVPLADLLAKCKDPSLLYSERQEWFKKLQEQYPEYASFTIDKLP
jgi:hypothetical protein